MKTLNTDDAANHKKSDHPPSGSGLTVNIYGSDGAAGSASHSIEDPS
jgi:hypothetical protein